MSEVLDLDILLPKKRMIKIGEKQIDVGFLPTAITFEVGSIMEELQGFTPKQIEKDPEISHRAYNLAVELCALFCSVKNPEMDVEWFRENTVVLQINALVDVITQTVQESYKGIEEYPGNSGAAGK